MKHTTPRRSPWFAMMGLALLLTPAVASANAYQFDEMCAPTTLHDTEAVTPYGLLIVDVSGSMGGDGGGGKTKMQHAKDAVTDLANSVHRAGTCDATDDSGCDQIRLGLGYFSNSAGVDVAPAEDTKDAVISTVNSYSDGGGTYIGDAAREIFEDNALSNPTNAGAGIIITDGVASSEATIADTAYYLCNARFNGTPTYMVGFGSGTDPEMNGFYAALGGTGECCTGSSCTYQPGEMVDPCLAIDVSVGAGNVDVSLMVSGNDLKGGYNCRGGIQADSGQQLKDELLQIAQDIACTFPLEIPMAYPPGDGADADPEATRVELYHEDWGFQVRLPATDPSNPNALPDLLKANGLAASIADTYAGEGWFFTDPARQFVRLTEKLCGQVRTENVDVVETQVACVCAPGEGELCDVECGQDPDAGCEQLPGDTEPFQAGRCRVGRYICDLGQLVCQKVYSPQPEICNGIDDDCDGAIDNLGRANPEEDPDDMQDVSGRQFFEWDEDTMTLADKGLDEGIFCNYQSVCVCPEGPEDYGAEPGPMAGQPEWNLMLDAVTGACGCSAGLEYAEEDGFYAEGDDPNAYGEPAACTISAVPSRVRSAGMLLLLGVFVLGARRGRRRD